MRARQMVTTALASILVLAVIVGVVTMAGQDLLALLEGEPRLAAELLLMAGLGILIGAIVRTYEPGNLYPAVFALVVLVESYVVRLGILNLLDGQALDAGLADPQVASVQGPLATSVGYLALALRSRHDPSTEGSRRVSLDELHERLEQRNLLIDGRQEGAGEAGLVCGICREDLRESSRWLARFLRCPNRPSEHVFHARCFQSNNWRCPRCYARFLEDDEVCL